MYLLSRIRGVMTNKTVEKAPIRIRESMESPAFPAAYSKDRIAGPLTEASRDPGLPRVLTPSRYP
jgi:hypothetical protein